MKRRALALLFIPKIIQRKDDNIVITKVTKDNSKLYRELFDKAEVYLNGQNAFDSYDPENAEGYIAIHSLDEYFAVLEELTTGNSYDGESANNYHVFKILPLDEPTFDIDANSRDIHVPEVFRKNGVGVQGDQLAETLFFTIDRYFEDIDLFRDDILGIVQWESAAKGKQYETGWSEIAFKDVTIVKNKMIFGWFLNDIITSNPGTVKFSVRFFSTVKETNDRNQEVLKLDFSLSTKTQTITINPAIAYDINEESGLPEVNGYNDLSLVVNRFKDSVYVGEADSAEDPVFTREHGGIFATDAQCIKHVEGVDKDGNKINIHIVDLEDDGTLTLSTDAYSTDAGKISYFWYEKRLDANAIEEKNTAAGPVYIPTSDFSINGEKTYYKMVTANGIDTFVEDKTLVDGDMWPVDDNGKTIQYYECFNGIVVDKTGEYRVVAKNRHGVASAEVTSDVVKVPGPADLVVEAPETSGNFLNSEGYISLRVTGTTEQVGDKIHYIWQNLSTAQTLDEEQTNNLGYNADGSTKNNGSTWNNAEAKVAVEDLPYYDEDLEVTVYAERNKDKTPVQKFAIRVTAEPHALTVAPIDTAPEANLVDDIAIGVTVSCKRGDDEREIVSDEIKYQWFKYTSNTEDDDLIVEGATEATYLVPGGANAASGIYYCRVTNVVNGASIAVNSDRISVNRA
jgi:hypothetical protein